MSEALSIDLDELPEPVCDFCGSFIDEDEKDCPALDDGWCSP